MEPWVVVDDAGEPVPLTPGQTWIALPKPEEAQVMSDAEASALFEIRDAEDLS